MQNPLKSLFPKHGDTSALKAETSRLRHLYVVQNHLGSSIPEEAEIPTPPKTTAEAPAQPKPRAHSGISLAASRDARLLAML